MFNASFSYTAREGVTINFSVTSYYYLRPKIHFTNTAMTEKNQVRKQEVMPLKNGKVHFSSTGSLVE